jgi:serine/threonine-protein kinase
MTDDDRLAELLLTWEERYQRGDDVPAAELCRECPDLFPALVERIELLRRVLWVNRPPGDDGQQPGGELPSEPLVGRYRLEERVGEGGHGQVFRAFDLQLQRPVAVKIPRPDFLLVRPNGRDAFVEEARRLARFSYPGIVRVYDVGLHDGYDFIVSEWIDGIDLAQFISAGIIQVREAARIGAELARHLHHAHERGFVHRDVKPANILLQTDGRVIVTDFGIAVEAGAPGRESGGTGTISYMAPERLSGNAGADVRIDVYGLGAVLYEMLTGYPPFAGSTRERLRLAILAGDLAQLPQWRTGSCHPYLTAICRRCMAINPAARYQSADAVADDLGRWLAEPEKHEAGPDGRIAHPVRNVPRSGVDDLIRRGTSHALKQEFAEALSVLSEAVRLDPHNAEVFARRGFIHYQASRTAEAVEDFSEAIGLNPGHTFALNNLAWLLSTSLDPDIRDGERAVPLATRACELTGWIDPVLVSTLAAAHAECGDFLEAVRLTKDAIALGITHRKDLEAIRKQLELYESGQPSRK